MLSSALITSASDSDTVQYPKAFILIPVAVADADCSSDDFLKGSDPRFGCVKCSWGCLCLQMKCKPASGSDQVCSFSGETILENVGAPALYRTHVCLTCGQHPLARSDVPTHTTLVKGSPCGVNAREQVVVTAGGNVGLQASIAVACSCHTASLSLH